MNPMKEKYLNEVVPAMQKRLNLDNPMQYPRIEKVVVNIGLGEALDNPKAIDAAVGDLTQITGQKPIVTKARVNIANFKLREGRQIGAKVTLRGEKMWGLLDRVINIVLPRVRDFRGISPDAFDGCRKGPNSLGWDDENERWEDCSDLLTIFAPAGGATQAWAEEAGILFAAE